MSRARILGGGPVRIAWEACLVAHEQARGSRAWRCWCGNFKRDPYAADVFVFRGRSGSLIEALWHDGLGRSLRQPQPDGVEAGGSANPGRL